MKTKKTVKNYSLIFVISLLCFFAGLGIGIFFFTFFKQESVLLINKLKLVQGFLGIREYTEGMSFVYVFLVIFFGNLFSTAGYFALGYLKALIPISLVSGFFIVIFLLSGTIRHSEQLPLSMVILSSIEMLYRVMAVSLGEYISKSSSGAKFAYYKVTIWVTTSVISFLFLGGIAYELWLIYG